MLKPSLLFGFTTVAFSLLGTQANAATINTDFSNPDAIGLNLNGAAEVFSDPSYLRLTGELFEGGSAFIADPIQIDSDTSFSTTFDFRINDLDAAFGIEDYRGADGLVFLVQSQGPDALGPGGVGLGNLGISPSVGVEFDTFQNSSVQDESGNHIGINLNGSVDSVTQQRIGRPINDTEIRTARIDYSAETDQLEVRLGEEAPSLEDEPVVTYDVDLAEVLGPNAYVGFSSGTGSGSGNHNVLGWQFQSTDADEGASVPEPGLLIGLAAVSGLGLRSLLAKRKAC